MYIFLETYGNDNCQFCVSKCIFVILLQVLGKVPTISIDKTDGCQMFLSKESLQTEIITAKSSEMNVMIPNGDEFVSSHFR